MRVKWNLLVSDFGRNMSTLMFGTLVSLAIPIVITPLLTRLYSPEEFGILALFLSISAIIGSIASAQYDQAIMLPDCEEDSSNLLVLSITTSAILSLLSLLVIAFFSKRLANALSNPDIENWLYFIPVSVFMIGTFNSFRFYSLRHKSFKNISLSLVSRSVGLGISQLSFGIIGFTNVGLIFGQIVSHFLGNFYLWRSIRGNVHLGVVSTASVKMLATKYRKFPLYSMPAVLINSINLNAMSLCIPFLFNASTLGIYAIAMRLIGIPMKIIGGSFAQVYFQKASEEIKITGTTERIFLGSVKKLVLLALPMFTIIYVLVDPLVVLVLGEEWVIAGKYAKIVIPMFGIRFVASAVSNTLTVHEKQQYSLIFNLIMVISMFIQFAYAYYFDIEFAHFLVYYSRILALEYLVFLIVHWRISRIHKV